MLVNKQYLEETARVWLRTKTFVIFASNLESALGRMNPWEKYLMLSITSLRTSWPDSEMTVLRKMPNFTRLETGLEDSDFETNDTEKSPWIDEYTDAEIAANRYVRKLLVLRGLKDLKINWSLHFAKPNSEEMDKFERFKLQVKTLIEDIVYQPRDHIEPIKTALSLKEALAKSPPVVNASGRISITEPSSLKQKVSALADDEVPENQDSLVRTFLLHPEAMTKWIREAKRLKAESMRSVRR